MPIEITMPALSPTMTEGNLAKWVKKEGDKVKPGQVIAEIETDKATMEVEAVDEGTIGKIIVAEGTQGVAVNSVIALLLEDGEDKKSLDSYQIKQPEKPKEEKPAASKAPASKAPTAAPAATKAPVSAQANVAAPAPNLAPQARQSKEQPQPAPTGTPNFSQSTTNNQQSTNIKASPLAKKIANLANVQLSMLKGTGPKGRIVRADVEEHLSRGGASSGGGTHAVVRDSVEFVTIPNNNIKQITAKRLLESKQTVPHFYLSIDCNVDDLLEARQHVNDLAKGAYKISVNDMVIKASALALKSVPAANSSWYDDAIVRYNNVDISVAVATDNGLITPIIFNADQKSVSQISNEMKDLAKLARDNKLKPHQFQGGGFSISNLGMFGIKQFSAIINPPQSCILAVGASEQKVVVHNGNIEVANIMNVTLSVDHRSVDGAVGAQFLQEFKKYIENPVTLFI